MIKTISRSDVTILLESRFSSVEYPNLVASLLQGRRNISSLHDLYESAHLARIIGSCKAEWRYDEHTDPLPVTSEALIKVCQLCGTKSVKSLYLICNNVNGTELWVGSECVNKYKFDHYISLNDLLKRQRATLKYKSLSDIIPHIVEDYFHQNQAHARSSVYLLPKDMEDSNISIFTKIRKLANDFIASESSNQSLIVENILELIKQYHQSSKEIDEYQSLNSPNWLYPKKSYLQQTPSTILKAIKKSLSIDGSTIGHIINMDFSQEHILPRLNCIINNTGIVFSSVNQLPNDVEYYGELNSFHFTIGHKRLCKEFGNNLVSQTHIPSTYYGYFLRMTTPTPIEQERLLREICSYLSRWSLRAVSYALAYNHLYIIKDRSYIRLPLSDVVSYVKPGVMLKRHYEAPSIITDILKDDKNRIDYAEYMDILYMGSYLADYKGRETTRIDPEFVILDS